MLYLMCLTLFILIVIIVDTVNQANIRQNNRMKLEGNPNIITRWKKYKC
jgi:hypothetical protein